MNIGDRTKCQAGDIFLLTEQMSRWLCEAKAHIEEIGPGTWSCPLGFFEEIGPGTWSCPLGFSLRILRIPRISARHLLITTHDFS